VAKVPLYKYNLPEQQERRRKPKIAIKKPAQKKSQNSSQHNTAVIIIPQFINNKTSSLQEHNIEPIHIPRTQHQTDPQTLVPTFITKPNPTVVNPSSPHHHNRESSTHHQNRTQHQEAVKE